MKEKGNKLLKHNKAVIKIDSHLLELINKCHAYIACVWHKFIAFNRHYHISEFQAPSAKRERPKKTLIIQLFSILKMSFIYDYGKYRGNVNRKGLVALKNRNSTGL